MEKEDIKVNKVLISVYELEKKRKLGTKITREMIIVKTWQMFPSDFSLRGYPEHPAGDLARRLLTNLKRDNFVIGGVNNYKITEKGKKFIEEKNIRLRKETIESNIKEAPRYIESEITRILNSKVFSYFLNGEKDFLENDLFEFLGTSARSLKDPNKSDFLSRYNLIAKEIIPFCKENVNLNKNFIKIGELWEKLEDKFGSILKR